MLGGFTMLKTGFQRPQHIKQKLKQQLFSRDSNLRNSSVSPFVCLSVCLNSSIFHLASLYALVSVRPSDLAPSLSSSCQLYHQSMLDHQAQLLLSLDLASYLFSLCQAISIALLSLSCHSLVSLLSLSSLSLVSLQSLTRHCDCKPFYVIGLF